MVLAGFIFVVSAVIIITPFVQAFRWFRGDEIDREYAGPMLAVGFLALVWVGLTAMQLISEVMK